MLQEKPICTHLHLSVLLTRQGSAALSLSTSYSAALKQAFCQRQLRMPLPQWQEAEIVIQY